MEGRVPTKRRERHGATLKSTMTQKIKRLDLITQTLGKLACTEHALIKCKAKSQANKGRICELPNEAGTVSPRRDLRLPYTTIGGS